MVAKRRCLTTNCYFRRWEVDFISHIDKTKPIPLYYQIKQEIILQIKNNKLTVGDKLPTEKWFNENYCVSRVTIRKAISELISEGVLERIKGKGPVVAKPKFRRQLGRLSSTTEDMTDAGVKSFSKNLSVIRKLSSGKISEHLKVEDGEHLIEIHKIRLVDGQPFADQVIYLRERFCKELDLSVFENKSLYEILEKDLNLKLSYAEQVIDVTMPSRRQKKDLELQENIPLLHSTRITYLDTGETIEYSDNFYISDRYKYSITLYR